MVLPTEQLTFCTQLSFAQTVLVSETFKLTMVLVSSEILDHTVKRERAEIRGSLHAQDMFGRDFGL